MSALGRWTSVDPLAEKHPEWSPYNYVLNNPVKLVDPNGAEACCLPKHLQPVAVQNWQDRRARGHAMWNEGKYAQAALYSVYASGMRLFETTGATGDILNIADPLNFSGMVGFAKVPVTASNLSRTLTGTTESGLERTSSAWRSRYGPAAMRDHHLIPQELLKDPRFTERLESLGVNDVQRFIDKKISRLPNATHQDLHAAGWNSAWKAWLNENPKFTMEQLEAQIKQIMKDYNLPKSSRDAKEYGRN